MFRRDSSCCLGVESVQVSEEFGLLFSKRISLCFRREGGLLFSKRISLCLRKGTRGCRWRISPCLRRIQAAVFKEDRSMFQMRGWAAILKEN